MLTGLADPRARRGRRHSLAVVAVGIAAVLAGARSYVAVAEWLGDQCDEVLGALGSSRDRLPTESTIRRVFTRLDPNVLDAAIGAWMWTATRHIAGCRVIAVDGKTIRGARTAGAQTPHLVAAFDHAASVVLAQVVVAAKTNEIPTVRTLLKILDLTETVVTIDAMRCQDETAQLITDAGGDYVVTVKGNQPGLHAALKALPWKDVPPRASRSRPRAAGSGARSRPR